jgi:hypothetical protein
MINNRSLQKKVGDGKEDRIENEETRPFFIPDSHKRMCESGLSGQRHDGNFADVDGLRDLKAEDVLNVRRRIASRSRPPQIKISVMPLSVQVKKVNKQEPEQYNRNFLQNQLG